MKIKDLEELLHSVRNKEMNVMVDATKENNTQFHLVVIKSAVIAETSLGDEILLLTPYKSELLTQNN